MRNLLDALVRLPGIGPRSAQRIAFYLLRSEEREWQNLVASLGNLKLKLRFCSVCGNLTSGDPCPICDDNRRDHALICVVEEPKDVIALEQTGSYAGVYHVLMGKIAPLEGIGPEELRVKELVARVRKTLPREVILATGSDADGETTSLYLARLLRPSGIKMTRIAAGIPVGSSLDFVDSSTLTRALEGRRDI
jgi:recombination protein RecR